MGCGHVWSIIPLISSHKCYLKHTSISFGETRNRALNSQTKEKAQALPPPRGQRFPHKMCSPISGAPSPHSPKTCIPPTEPRTLGSDILGLKPASLTYRLCETVPISLLTLLFYQNGDNTAYIVESVCICNQIMTQNP